MWQNPVRTVNAYSLKKSNNPLHVYSPHLSEISVPLGKVINVQSTRVYGGMGYSSTHSYPSALDLVSGHLHYSTA